MKCSSIGASKSAPAAGSGRGWRQLPCRAVGSAPPLPELRERGLIKKEKKKKLWRNKKSPAHTLLSRKEIKCLGGGGGVEEREGGSSTAGRWQGRCEKGRSGASWWQRHCLSCRERPWGQSTGSWLAWGPRDRACGARGSAGTRLELGCGSNIALRWQRGTRTRSVPTALQVMDPSPAQAGTQAGMCCLIPARQGWGFSAASGLG